MPQTSTLVDFVVAVHFESDLPLSVLDLADWTRAFGEEFPVVSQLPSLARADILVSPFQLQMVQPPELPLMQVATSDGRLYLKFQADRLALGWRRLAPHGLPDDYPGFDEMMSRFRHSLSSLEGWLEVRSKMPANARLLELAYNNAKPLQSQGKLGSLAETFAFLKTVGRRFSSFQMQWSELIGEDQVSPRVNAYAGLAHVNGSDPGMAFNFLGLAPVAGSLLGEETMGMFEVLHQRILDMYSATIISDTIDDSGRRGR